mmetsp:Transcript_6043/g.17848  ORF Transcript_6043/g.17848 Transcript_6043/m.17848 type:complete len:297 (+) Transcript_6043:73-963(+)
MGMAGLRNRGGETQSFPAAGTIFAETGVSFQSPGRNRRTAPSSHFSPSCESAGALERRRTPLPYRRSTTCSSSRFGQSMRSSHRCFPHARISITRTLDERTVTRAPMPMRQSLSRFGSCGIWARKAALESRSSILIDSVMSARLGIKTGSSNNSANIASEESPPRYQVKFPTSLKLRTEGHTASDEASGVHASICGSSSSVGMRNASCSTSMIPSPNTCALTRAIGVPAKSFTRTRSSREVSQVSNSHRSSKSPSRSPTDMSIDRSCARARAYVRSRSSPRDASTMLVFRCVRQAR